MNIIGRIYEQDQIEQCAGSGKPEFLVVYGRRRVGKTFLIKEYFNNSFSFYATGMLNEKTHDQLKAFNESLIEYGDTEKKIPKDWFEAFRRLRKILEGTNVNRDMVSGRRVVFLDELPWMDTARSDFKSALDYFWNSWASSESDILLIVCGSATSWIINNIFNDRGGLYNRITRSIHLDPFDLSECEEFINNNGIEMTRKQIIECYMVFGGVPYYLNLLDRRLSLAQNIERLVINERGQLHYEYEHLFHSLFNNANNHIKIIEALSSRRSGMMRTELTKLSGVGDGAALTKAINELEQCGFIRKYKNYAKKKQGFFYQVIDSFVLFSLYFLKDKDLDSWQSFLNSPGYYAWRGNSFEIVCLNHVYQIKSALGIAGVDSTEYSWRSKDVLVASQIDLMIDRNDGIINVCEMKYTNDEFEIDAEYEKQLLRKLDAFRKETSPKKALHITMVTADGLKKNAHSHVVQNVIDGEALFIKRSSGWRLQ